MDETFPTNPRPVSWVRDVRRWTLASVGVVSVGLAWLGVFVPGMPTTIFLIIASYCFARSCPWLERRLLRVPVFARYMAVLDQGRGMSRRAAVSALVSMWSCVAVSLGLLYGTGRLRGWVALVVIGSAIAGSAMIAMYARTPVRR